MIRVRFHANIQDPRPVNWPVRHPYWIAGEGEDYAVVVSYADDENYILANWPEASHLIITEVDGYLFTSRFPQPDWFKEMIKNTLPCGHGKSYLLYRNMTCGICGKSAESKQ